MRKNVNRTSVSKLYRKDNLEDIEADGKMMS
jgi:hypothetical protein